MGGASVLELTAKDLQALLTSGQTTSMGIVSMYLKQIQAHNGQGMKLRALIETAPINWLQEETRKSDAERQEGKLRGPLHGIPIVVKDNICTPSCQMKTTLGTLAFRHCNGTRDGVGIQRLRQAGAIILGKSNLSELGNMKGANLTGGWSALGGQTQSPYVRGGVDPNDSAHGNSTPMGSSSGSAVSVAAGFAPIAIGTETDGSVVHPAARAALYSLKTTCNVIDGAGMQAAAPAMDTLGGMAKTVEDLANLMSVILDDSRLAKPLDTSWSGIRIATLDQEKWTLPSKVLKPVESVNKEKREAFMKACQAIEARGGQITPVDLGGSEEICDKYKVTSPQALLTHSIRGAFEGFLSKDLSDSPYQTLEELIKFNEEHTESELPPGEDNQQTLQDAANDKMSDEEHDRELPRSRAAFQEAIKSAMDSGNADVILTLADSPITSVVAMAGYPLASAPLGFATFNGRAFGVLLLAPANEERLLLRVMAAWEATLPNARVPPPLLKNHEYAPAHLA